MTQEEKELLLQDLCARLPYHPKCVCYWKEKPQNDTDGYVTELTTYELDQFMDADKFDDISIREIKPYLRPMSSLTEEEVKEIQKINWQFTKVKNVECYVGAADDGYCSISQMADILEYLNKHHFDYRGLIPKGLALEAPDDMYNLEKK